MNVRFILEDDPDSIIVFDTEIEGVQEQFSPKTGQRVRGLIINNNLRVRSAHINFYRPFEMLIEELYEDEIYVLELDRIIHPKKSKFI